MDAMAKPKSSAKKRPRAGSGSHKVAGYAHDGVKILAPKTKPTHFTSREIRETILEIRAKAGDFAGRDRSGQDRKR